MNKKAKVVIDLLLVAMFGLLVVVQNLNTTKANFIVKTNNAGSMSVPDFGLDYKLLDSSNEEVSNIEFDTDYTLEIYNSKEIPCNFFITPEGTEYNSFSQYLKITVEPAADAKNYCDYANGSIDYMLEEDGNQENLCFVQKFKETDQPIRFKLRISTSLIRENIDLLKKRSAIKDDGFKLVLTLNSYTVSE